MLWSWLYGSWIYNTLSPLALCVWLILRWGVLDTTLCDEVFQWLQTGWWFSPDTPVSFTNQSECHNITEILWKGALNTITLTLTLLLWYCKIVTLWKCLKNSLIIFLLFVFSNSPFSNLHHHKDGIFTYKIKMVTSCTVWAVLSMSFLLLLSLSSYQRTMYCLKYKKYKITS